MKDALENTKIGSYRLVEARELPTNAIHWRVYRDGAEEPISTHWNRTAAISAIVRYERTDARRGT